MGGLRLLYICPSFSSNLLLFHLGTPTPTFVGGCEPWCAGTACQSLLLGVKHLAFEGRCGQCPVSVPFTLHCARESPGLELLAHVRLPSPCLAASNPLSHLQPSLQSLPSSGAWQANQWACLSFCSSPWRLVGPWEMELPGSTLPGPGKTSCHLLCTPGVEQKETALVGTTVSDCV